MLWIHTRLYIWQLCYPFLAVLTLFTLSSLAELSTLDSHHELLFLPDLQSCLLLTAMLSCLPLTVMSSCLPLTFINWIVYSWQTSRGTVFDWPAKLSTPCQRHVIRISLNNYHKTVIGEVGLSWLHRISTVAWRQQIVPDEWRKPIIVPICKGKSSKRKCNPLRGICLLSHAGEIYEKKKILEKRPPPILEE